MWQRLWWLWLCVLLGACASAPAVREVEEYPEAYTGLDEGACVTFVCVEEACGLFRCEDVEAEPGRVVRTRGAFVIPPRAVRSPERQWDYVWPVPGRAEPVFVIRWYGRELLPSQKKLLEMAQALASKPREKHHIFPREEGLRLWFERQGINIHQETMLLDIDTHHRIHKGVGGGAWNQAWWKFRESHQRATKEDMYRYARELIIRFNLIGPILPYHLLVAPPIEY
jgi:uncharacterized lipoprotein (TIGR02269 family)